MSGGGNPTQFARDKAIAGAFNDGNLIVYGDDYTIQLDIDSPGMRERAVKLIKRFYSHLGVTKVHAVESKSKGHCHLYVRLSKPMGRADRIFWQAALGSDRVREGLNWLWMTDGHKGECFLSEAPGAEMLELVL